MLQLLKWLPKLFFDQKIKFYIGLLMLAKQALEDILQGKKESLAVDAVVMKAYDLLPADIKVTASPDECQALVETALDLIRDVQALFEPNAAGPPAPKK